jgi:lactate dehydrogenase-like 2-hydroxyacid dehydrogenase
VTDSLFIFDEHVKQLEAAGFEVERLDKPEATEEELVEAIKGKVGYILGGIATITQPVIDAADELKVITFTGIGYKGHIPVWEAATEKGITITNTPDGPTQAVAEWSLAATLLMTRGLLQIGPTGNKEFLTTTGIENQTVGIIGMGRMGQRIAEMLQPFKPKEIIYSSLHQHAEAESKLNIRYVEQSELLAASDIIYVCVSIDAGMDYIGESDLKQLHDGALIVSFSDTGIVNEDVLLAELQTGRLRAAFDKPANNKELAELPLDVWFNQHGSNAFNTYTELKLTSDTATQSIINILKTGQDKYKVN